MKRFPIVLLLVFSGPGPLLRATEPIEPLPPANLIKYLPSAPEGMKMLKSWAKQDLSDWMVTIAGRDFELPLPPPDLEGSPGPSALIRVRITDTGFWPASLARFHDFKPGNEGVEERVIWQGIPMIRLTLEDKNRQRAILCVADRFLVLVDTTYLKKKEVEDFLKSIPLADLARISTAGNKTLPQPVVLSEIDEINPKKNRSFRLFKTEVPEEASPQQN